MFIFRKKSSEFTGFIVFTRESVNFSMRQLLHVAYYDAITSGKRALMSLPVFVFLFNYPVGKIFHKLLKKFK